MQLPGTLHGTYEDVNARLRQRPQDCLRLTDAAAPVDTARVPGLLLLAPPSDLLVRQPHFHCYLPHFIFLEAVDAGGLPPSAEDDAFEAAVQTAWGVLGLLAPANRMWVLAKERHLPLLRAAIRFWDTLDGVGARYSVGSTTGESLWSVGTNVKYVLANLGVSAETLAGDLPAGGLAAWLPR